MDESELLPCPFCGEQASLTNVRMSDQEFRIGCYNELCWRPGTDYYSCKETLIKLWNTRTAPPDTLNLIEKEKRDGRNLHRHRSNDSTDD